MPNLLVATDFSSRSDRALKRAVLIARAADYGLFLGHVVDADQQSNRVDVAVARADAAMTAIGEAIRHENGLECGWNVRIGVPDEELAMLAEEADAEMILVGAHKPRLLDRFMGTMAERLVRRCHVPVLVAKGEPVGGYSSVLLPTDLRAASRHAAQVAANLPFLDEAEFCFLHAYELFGSELSARAMVSSADNDHQEVAAELRIELDRFMVSTGIGRPFRTEIRAVEGLLVQDLIDAAEGFHADLIVVAPSNRGVVERLMVGSVTQGLLRGANCDVLVVPA